MTPFRPIVLALLAAIPTVSALAQTGTPRRRVNQEHAWLQFFSEQPLAPRWTLFNEAQLRRADLSGSDPQQVVLRPGVLYDIRPDVRVGAGYLWAWTSVYGEAPSAAAFPEHRTWQQLQLNSRTGPVAWAHRFRAEQRWLGQAVATPGGGTTIEGWRFRQRARIMTRSTVDARAIGIPVSRAYVTGYGELFAQIGATTDGQVFDQSRLGLQGGWRLSPRLRVEAGYMQQLIQRGGSRVTENNHTLVLSVFHTGR